MYIPFTSGLSIISIAAYDKVPPKTGIVKQKIRFLGFDISLKKFFLFPTTLSLFIMSASSEKADAMKARRNGIFMMNTVANTSR